jgi:parvulin-like peptidyl-prolyl isomerase
MRRVLMSIAALLLVARPAPAGDVAARVNGTPIDSAMVNEVVKGVIAGRGQAPPPDSEEIARLTDQALDSLIDLELLYQAAQAQQLTVSEQEVDADIAQSRKHFASDADFNAALQHSGLTPERLRADTRKTLLVSKLLTTVVWRGVQVAPDAPRRFYDEHRAELGAQARPFEKMEPSIRETLLQEAREDRQRAYVADLRRGAKIEKGRAALLPAATAAPPAEEPKL